MSTTETEKQEEPKIDEATGLPEGLDPGHSWETHSPEERSEPLPSSFHDRLTGLSREEADVLLAQERVEKAEAAVAEKDETPSTPEEELAAAKKALSEAEKNKADADKKKEEAAKQEQQAAAKSAESASKKS